MGLFGGSSSKSDTSQSQVGSQTQLGNPVSINISGNKKHSKQLIKLEEVDHGSVEKAFNLADKVLGVNDSVLSVAQNFALDTISNAGKISSEIIAAGQNSAGTTERIAGALESFVSDQNNPNEKNQMVLIIAGLAAVSFVAYKVKK